MGHFHFDSGLIFNISLGQPQLSCLKGAMLIAGWFISLKRLMSRETIPSLRLTDHALLTHGQSEDTVATQTQSKSKTAFIVYCS